MSLLIGKPNFQPAHTIDEDVQIAIACSNGQTVMPAGVLTREDLAAILKEKQHWLPE